MEAFGWSMTLSGDGTHAVIGVLHSSKVGDNSGDVRVYELNR